MHLKGYERESIAQQTSWDHGMQPGPQLPAALVYDEGSLGGHTINWRTVASMSIRSSLP